MLLRIGPGEKAGKWSAICAMIGESLITRVGNWVRVESDEPLPAEPASFCLETLNGAKSHCITAQR